MFFFPSLSSVVSYSLLVMLLSAQLRSPFDFLRGRRDTITASGAQPLDSDRLAEEGAAHISGACKIPLICLSA